MQLKETIFRSANGNSCFIVCRIPTFLKLILIVCRIPTFLKLIFHFLGTPESYRMPFFKDTIIDVTWVGWPKGVLSRVGPGALGKHLVMASPSTELTKLGSGVCRAASCWWTLLAGSDSSWKLWIGKYIFGKGHCAKHLNLKFIGLISN